MRALRLKKKNKTLAAIFGNNGINFWPPNQSARRGASSSKFCLSPQVADGKGRGDNRMKSWSKSGLKVTKRYNDQLALPNFLNSAGMLCGDPKSPRWDLIVETLT
jgi:hypothetical protein